MHSLTCVNSTHTPRCRSTTKQRLTVRVLDYDQGKSSDFLGSSMRGLADLCDGAPHQIELDLKGPRSKGSIELEAKFLPFKGEKGQ